MQGRTAYVRRRPNRGDKRNAMRGVIYLPNQFTGKKVKVVTIKYWEALKRRLRTDETKLRRIRNIVK